MKQARLSDSGLIKWAWENCRGLEISAERDSICKVSTAFLGVPGQPRAGDVTWFGDVAQFAECLSSRCKFWVSMHWAPWGECDFSTGRKT